MTIEILNPVFAENGDVDTDAVFNSWASNGYTPSIGRVRYKGINKVLNRADAKLNEVIERLPKSLPDEIGELPFVQNLFTPTNDFSNAGSNLNVFDLSGDVSNFKDICFAIINGERKILIVDYSTADSDPIKVFDIATGAYESACGDISGDLSTPTTDWCSMSICCDATYCYVVFRDEGPTPDEFRVQSWALTDWSVNPGWPSTGLALTAGSVSIDDEMVRIRNAADDKLACTQPWVAVSSGTSAGINIISKDDGTSDGVGAGNVGSVSNGQVSAVCSDGTTVFFSVELAASVMICGMTIASPGANGPSGVHWPYAYSCGPTEFGGIACSGNIIVATWMDETALFTVLHTERGYMARYDTGNSQEANICGPVCFDGEEFWSFGERIPYVGYDVAHLFRLAGAHRGGNNETAGPYQEIVSDGESFVESFLTTASYSGTKITYFYAGGILSDGRDLWFYGAQSQKLYRLPRSLTK